MPTLIEQLQPQCITPDILNEIRIERYMQVCERRYAGCFVTESNSHACG